MLIIGGQAHENHLNVLNKLIALAQSEAPEMMKKRKIKRLLWRFYPTFSRKRATQTKAGNYRLNTGGSYRIHEKRVCT
jgi:hypothetical protein